MTEKSPPIACALSFEVRKTYDQFAFSLVSASTPSNLRRCRKAGQNVGKNLRTIQRMPVSEFGDSPLAGQLRILGERKVPPARSRHIRLQKEVSVVGRRESNRLLLGDAVKSSQSPDQLAGWEGNNLPLREKPCEGFGS